MARRTHSVSGACYLPATNRKSKCRLLQYRYAFGERSQCSAICMNILPSLSHEVQGLILATCSSQPLLLLETADANVCRIGEVVNSTNTIGYLVEQGVASSDRTE